MKISKLNLLPLLIAIILFLIPFLWLRPGEMDLGGDGNRLYFYDPVSYLQLHTPYNIIPTGIGGDSISYYALPLVSLFAVLGYIVSIIHLFLGPATLLIGMVNGMKLSIAFISCYFIVKELFTYEYKLGKSIVKGITEISAIFAGLFYIFSPILINSGWDKAILSHIQIFLNPLMFLLLLRYFTTHKTLYLLGLLLVTFIFSLNFSYAAAPAFFAFYPLSFLFLFLYTKFIRKIRIPIKGLIVGGVVALLLNAFHIFPHVFNILSFGGDVSSSVFSDQTKFSRGLDYFTGIAPSVKASVGLLNLAQLRDIVLISLGFFIFPATILLSFLFNKKNKTRLLTGAFFLIVTFFATASITDIGFNFYKTLFYIPGFKMFRNFFAQWSFAQVFFYTLLFGQALGIVLHHTKKIYRILLLSFILTILSITAWPLMIGNFTNSINWLSKEISIVIQMDPQYEEALRFVREYPEDAKILSFPLTGPSYHVVAGKNGGAYVGPPMFSYIAGKNDFAGYESLFPFNEIFVNAAKKDNFLLIQKLLSILNIKYIFYNSDPYIYGENFLGFPYDYVKAFLPETQEGYKSFIEKFPINKAVSFGEKYHFYKISENIFLPHIFTATDTLYTNDPLNFQFVHQFSNEPRLAVFDTDDVLPQDGKGLFVETNNTNPLSHLLKNEHLHRHEPYISSKLGDIYYYLSVYKEKIHLWRLRNNFEEYPNFSFFYLSKRIFEISKWKDEMLILRKEWKEPKPWEFYAWYTYNSWEAIFARYEKSASDLIIWVNNSPSSNDWKKAVFIKLKEQFYQHHLLVITNIKGYREKKIGDRDYLFSYANKTFRNLIENLDVHIDDPSSISYTLPIPDDQLSDYDPYLEDAQNQLLEPFIDLEGKRLSPLKEQAKDGMIEFDTVRINEQKQYALQLHITQENIINKVQWMSSGQVKEERETSELEVYHLVGNNNAKITQDTGIVQKITNWKPKTQYLITFDYLTQGDDFIFSLYDRAYKFGLKNSLGANLMLQRLLNSNTWKNHQAIVTSAPDTEYGVIQFSGNSEKENSEIYIKNLSVVEIVYPKIYFKKVSKDQKAPTNPPKIIFKKINPTKYHIQVFGAKEQYTLVFLEKFNKNWKLQNPEKNTENMRGNLARLYGTISKYIVSLFIKNSGNEDKIVASHLNGDVKESNHNNIFLEPNTSETWGKDAIAEDRHFYVNGYANGWNIEPLDMDGKENYTLILEMTTQKQFYLFLPISLLTAIILFIVFVVNIFKKHEKNL